MRILFVIPYVPTLSRGRSYHFIRTLAAQGHQITLACLSMEASATDNDAQAALSEFCKEVHVSTLSQFESLAQCARYVASATPLWAASCFSPSFETLVERLTASEKFDLVHAVRLRGAGLVRRIHGRVPIVYDAVECVTDTYGNFPQDTDLNSFGQSFSRSEQSKLRRYEPRTASLFERVLTATEYDTRRLTELADAEGLTLPTEILQNGIDLDTYRPMPHVPILPGNILLSGKVHYAANRDAARYFCNEIFPAVRQTHPMATVTIVGTSSATDLQALANQRGSGVEIVERVPDLRPYLARAALVVCPLRVGSGVKGNVLETLGMGKALVATTLAARPMNDTAAGNSLCVAETALAFATQVMHLLSHPEEVARLGANARRYAETNHDWNKLAEQLNVIYEQVTAGENTGMLVS